MNIQNSYFTYFNALSQINSLQEYLSKSVKVLEHMAVSPMQQWTNEINSIMSDIQEIALTANNTIFQEVPLTQQIIENAVHYSEIFTQDFPSCFINSIHDISVFENYVDVPNELCFAVDITSCKDCIEKAQLNNKKHRFTLEFFLSCVLPNIIALWAVLLTVYYHNIDSQKVSEENIIAEYTQSLEEFNSTLSTFIDCLQANGPIPPSLPTASPSNISGNPSSELFDDFDSSNIHVHDNLDMHQ